MLRPIDVTRITSDIKKESLHGMTSQVLKRMKAVIHTGNTLAEPFRFVDFVLCRLRTDFEVFLPCTAEGETKYTIIITTILITEMILKYL